MHPRALAYFYDLEDFRPKAPAFTWKSDTVAMATPMAVTRMLKST